MDSIAIGTNAGENQQGGDTGSAIAIGDHAGENNQDGRTVAIGYHAGQTNQSNSSVAIGADSGQITQGDTSISVGYLAGNINQRLLNSGIGGAQAYGFMAGAIDQEGDAIAMGTFAGNGSQGLNSIAIGPYAGFDRQGGTTQLSGGSSIAMGEFAGEGQQGTKAIAIGTQAGKIKQRSNCIAIGTEAGNQQQGVGSVDDVPTPAIAIGYGAGFDSQGKSSGTKNTSNIAVGTFAGFKNQYQGSIAIGELAGSSDQGNKVYVNGATGEFGVTGCNAIAIGNYAGTTNQAQGSIIFNSMADKNCQSIPLENNPNIMDYLNPTTLSATTVAEIIPQMNRSWMVATKQLAMTPLTTGGLNEVGNTAQFTPWHTPHYGGGTGPSSRFTHYLVYAPTTGEIQICPWMKQNSGPSYKLIPTNAPTGTGVVTIGTSQAGTTAYKSGENYVNVSTTKGESTGTITIDYPPDVLNLPTGPRLGFTDLGDAEASLTNFYLRLPNIFPNQTNDANITVTIAGATGVASRLISVTDGGSKWNGKTIAAEIKGFVTAYKQDSEGDRTGLFLKSITINNVEMPTLIAGADTNNTTLSYPKLSSTGDQEFNIVYEIPPNPNLSFSTTSLFVPKEGGARPANTLSGPAGVTASMTFYKTTTISGVSGGGTTGGNGLYGSLSPNIFWYESSPVSTASILTLQVKGLTGSLPDGIILPENSTLNMEVTFPAGVTGVFDPTLSWGTCVNSTLSDIQLLGLDGTDLTNRDSLEWNEDTGVLSWQMTTSSNSQVLSTIKINQIQVQQASEYKVGLTITDTTPVGEEKGSRVLYKTDPSCNLLEPYYIPQEVILNNYPGQKITDEAGGTGSYVQWENSEVGTSYTGGIWVKNKDQSAGTTGYYFRTVDDSSTTWQFRYGQYGETGQSRPTLPTPEADSKNWITYQMDTRKYQEWLDQAIFFTSGYPYPGSVGTTGPKESIVLFPSSS